MNKNELKSFIGEKLSKGYEYDEAIACSDLDEESKILSDKFFNLCDEGVNKFEAFVKVFY